MTTSTGVDPASVEHRLLTMRKAIGQLQSLGPLGGARLAADPTTGLVVERILALLVDLAQLINTHASQAVLAQRPQTVAASFDAAQRIGMIDAALASALAPADGPHHVLMQLSLDVEPEEAAAVVAGALAGYGEYVRQVGRWLADQGRSSLDT